MKTLQKTLRTLTLVSLATTSLMAMEPTRHQQATYSLATDLLQCYILKKPERILQSIQTLSRTHDILKCSDIVTAALAEANISLEKIVDENGNTMLHLACSNDSSVNTVNIILTAEQNENLLVNLLSAKNKEGFTALDLATTRNQQETIRILLDTADNFLHIEETHNLVSCYQSQKVTTSRRSANNNDFSIEMGRSAINGHPQRINKINGQLPCNIAHPTQYNPSTNVPRFNESNRDDIGNVSGSSKNLMENK